MIEQKNGMQQERLTVHPDRGIVRTYRHSDGLSTIPYDPNTLTPQSAVTNDAPRDPLLGPVTGDVRHLIIITHIREENTYPRC